MHPLRALLATVLLLLPLSGRPADVTASSATPSPLKFLTRAEMIDCLDEKDAVQAEVAAADARALDMNKRMQASNAAVAAKSKEGAQVDTRNEAAVNEHNRQMDALNAQAEQFNAEVDRLKQAQDAVNARAESFNANCGQAATDKFTLEAVRRERAGTRPPPQAEARALKACLDMGEALVTGRTDALVALVHPSLARQAGKSGPAAQLRRQLSPREAPSARLMGVDCGLPVQASEAGAQRLLLLPVVVTADASDGIVKSLGYVLGISSDQGQTWTFLAMPRDAAATKTMLPGGVGGITALPARVSLIYPRNPL